jgi:chemotaxis protein methyltransferase WspC
MNSLSEIRRWLEETYGLNLEVIGADALERNVSRRIRARNLKGIAEYVRCWRGDPEERDILLQEMLVGETWFFREPPAFEVLKQWLMARMPRWVSGPPLRILVLPCASGEEAWSVAAVVHALGIPKDQVEIEAMDVNASALARAREGLYPARKAKDRIPLAPLGSCAGDMITVDPALRPMVRFERVNAMDRELFLSRGGYDVIFCRNLLIYMGASARLRVCETLSSCLSVGGLLFLGHAEQPPPDQGWQRLRVSGAFAWHRSTPAEMRGDGGEKGHTQAAQLFRDGSSGG